MQDIRKVVREGYEKGDYAKAFRMHTLKLTKFELNLFKNLFNLLPQKGKILDLGCGLGIPYDKYLVDNGFNLIGVDFSKKHVSMARKNVPKAKFIYKDFTKVKFRPATFDAIVSFYAIFHIPRKENEKLFLTINKLLKRNGIILVSLGTGGEEYGFEKNWIGASMAWSTYKPKEYESIIRNNGFKIIKSVFEGKPGDKEYHFWVLAKKLGKCNR
jgi:SAM-dependent methyltransferase